MQNATTAPTENASAPVVALSIAGFDPSSGAGITADLATFAAHGVFGISAITALTVQSTLGVQEVQPVDAALLLRTLDCLQADTPPAGIKIGMIAGAEQVLAVAQFVRRARSEQQTLPVVLDPVVRSSSGRPLLDDAGLCALVEQLLPLVDVVTPNIAELQALSNSSESGMEDGALIASARVLQRSAPQLRVLVTGGHREPPDDLLVEADKVHLFAGSRIPTRATHGTGCAFSSAVLANMVQGARLPKAVDAAKQYVRRAMQTAVPIGAGQGPMNHLWTRPLRPESGHNVG